MRSQRIRAKVRKSSVVPGPTLELGGWLSDGGTYLWFGINGQCVGILDKAPLYRLCRAILRRKKS